MKNTHWVPRTPLRFWWYIAQKNIRWMILATTFVILGSIAEAVIPYWVKKITDSITNGDASSAQFLIVWFGIFFLLNGLCWRWSGFSGMRWVTRSVQEANKGIMKYLTGHSESYFRDQFAWSLSNKIKNVTRWVQSLMETYLWWVLSLFVLLPISLYLAFTTNILVGSFIVLWIIIVIPVNIFFVKIKRKHSIEFAESGSSLSWQVVDVISNMSSVRQYVRQFQELIHVGSYIDKYQKSHLNNWRISEYMLLSNDIIQSLIFMWILVYCSLLWRDGIITSGDLLMIFNIGLTIEHRLMWIGNQVNDIMDSYWEIHEWLKVLFLDHEIVDNFGTLEYHPKWWKIELKKVCFSYGKNSIFKNLNCTIKAGEKVWLVGESGAGKSTLVQLLLRQYDIQSWEILFDDQNITEIIQDSLRNGIAFIPQDPSLFHRTIHQNIAYWRENMSRAEVIKAAKKAQAHEFISQLESWYDTVVGERWVKLSGWQRQRIVIARAILKNAPILILDEATSALDSESEQKIQEALKILMKWKTVIAIAHRLSTIKHLDRILVFKNGKIAEDGTHETLSNSKWIYQSLWDHQVGGFVGG